MSVEEDIRTQKEAILLRAINKGRSIIKAERELKLTRKRLMVPDRVTGVQSQRSTEKAVQQFYNDLYTATVPLPLHIPEAREPLYLFMVDELRYSMLSLKRGHSAGDDGILPDMLTLAADALAPLLTEMLNRLVIGERIPSLLVRARVSLLFKKGDSSDVNNFRPISLLSVVYKTLTRTVLRRMEGALELSENKTQAGFRKGYSTVDNIHTLKQVIEKATEYDMPVYIALVDYRKAFDSVEWPAVWTALLSQGVHPSLVNLLARLYDKASTEVQVNEGRVEVDVKRGVRQGDTMSPRLFNAVLRMALEH